MLAALAMILASLGMTAAARPMRRWCARITGAAGAVIGAQRRHRPQAVMAGAMALFAVTSLASPAHAERIKDLASIQGVRPNQLIGYGLVVGLDGSGDQTTQTPFTVQSLQTLLSQLGITLPQGASLQLKNVAAVMVTATLPPFAQPGQQVDVTASSLGNARSLRGGTLLIWSSLASERVITCDLVHRDPQRVLLTSLPPPGSKCRVELLTGNSHESAFKQRVSQALDGAKVDFLFIDPKHYSTLIACFLCHYY